MKRLRILLASLLVCCATGSAAQESSTPVMTSRGAFFALSVADMKASATWYIEKLGLAIVMEDAGGGHPAVTVLEGGGLIVELIQNDGAMPLSKAAPNVQDRMLVHGLVKAGVIVDNFDATLATFRKRRVDIAYGPFPARPKQRANLIVRDNAGNLIQVFGR
jgi:glyoxalase/bleomycin resistance protein/dioxygenase superfamily protein